MTIIYKEKYQPNTYTIHLDNDLIEDIFNEWELYNSDIRHYFGKTSLKNKDYTDHSYYPLALQKWWGKQKSTNNYNI